MDIKQPLDPAALSQAVALSSLLLYVLGFVIVNAHLAKWDVASFDFANAQYLAAGLLFAVFAAIFWFLVGRRIQNIENDFVEFAKLGREYKWPRTWAFFCLFQVFAELSFAFVVGAYWTASIFHQRSTQQIALTGALVVFFLIDYYVLWNKKIYQRAPAIALPIASIFHVLVVVTAFYWFPDAGITRIVIVYFGITFVLNFVLDIGRRRETNAVFAMFWTAVFVLGTAATFGASIYGHIKTSVGGGQARRVEVILNAAVPASLQSKLLGGSSTTAPILIYAETSDAIFLSRGSDAGEVIRVSKSAIAGVVTFEHKDKLEANYPVQPTPDSTVDRKR